MKPAIACPFRRQHSTLRRPCRGSRGPKWRCRGPIARDSCCVGPARSHLHPAHIKTAARKSTQWKLSIGVDRSLTVTAVKPDLNRDREGAVFLELLVTVVIRLVRTLRRHAEVFGLLLGEGGQLHADLLQVQARNLFVELLGQGVDADFVFILVLPQV
jgi:hypothetical protein